MKRTSPGNLPGIDMNESGKGIDRTHLQSNPNFGLCQWAFCWLFRALR
jgi:hypothetical protein